jgi:hypothetical protein
VLSQANPPRQLLGSLAITPEDGQTPGRESLGRASATARRCGSNPVSCFPSHPSRLTAKFTRLAARPTPLSRERYSRNSLSYLMARDGIEPPTRGFSVRARRGGDHSYLVRWSRIGCGSQSVIANTSSVLFQCSAENDDRSTFGAAPSRTTRHTTCGAGSDLESGEWAPDIPFTHVLLAASTNGEGVEFTRPSHRSPGSSRPAADCSWRDRFILCNASMTRLAATSSRRSRRPPMPHTAQRFPRERVFGHERHRNAAKPWRREFRLRSRVSMLRSS